ncbi:spore coat protein U domain-containing protein [Sulfurisoma sediminicola]|uniref:Spore coat protein U-like protein n=1 Tax=Sulfurisoma sediminicola TaxID=1381557 RepID=A0A497XB88_9PROT|nr:spore coat protein U domain-containing protein [Sulfurisoma sediminicola]RLJ63708.1 spore coat protein U-like protein [Sulfurisoma sediminicola]
MRSYTIRLLAALALMCAACAAQAVITCTVPTSGGFTTAYAGATGTLLNITQGTVTFSCTRSVGGDPLTVLLRANNGANALGVQNRARLGATGNYLNYDGHKNSTCTSLWTSLVVGDFMTINLAAVVGVAQPISVNFWGCVPAGQAAVAGTYTDTVSMRVRNNTNTNNLSPTGTFAVSITVPASCTIAAPAPSPLTINYTAFQPAPATGSTLGSATCTNNLPYELSLDVYIAVSPVSNLQYSLNIDGTAGKVSKRGNGGAQGYTINVSMPAGQAGKCSSGSCSGTQMHTIYVTY